MVRPTAFLPFALAALLFFAGAAFAQEKPGAPRPRGQVIEDGVLIDHDLSFRFAPKGWEVFPREIGTTLVPGSHAVALRRLMISSVGVETVSDEMTPETYAEKFVEVITRGRQQKLRIESKTVGDWSAAEMRCEAPTASGRMLYHGLILRRGVRFFRVVTFGEASSGATPELVAEPAKTLTLLGATPREPVKATAPRERAFGWIQSESGAQNLIQGIRARVPKGWRVFDGKTIQEMGGNFSFGIESADGELAVLMTSTSLRLAPERAEGLAELARNALATRLSGKAPEDVESLEIFGAPREVVRVVQKNGEWQHTVAAVGTSRWIHEIWTTCRLKTPEDRRRELDGILGTLEFIPARELERRRKEEYARPDPQVYLEEMVSVRDGVLHDFKAGLQFRKPKTGFWFLLPEGITKSGAERTWRMVDLESRAMLTASLVEADQVKDDASFRVFVERVGALMRDSGPSAEVGEPAFAERAGGGSASIDVVSPGATGQPVVERVVFLRRGSRVLQMVFGVQENRRAFLDAFVSTSLDAVSFMPGKLRVATQKGGELVNRRFGFAVALKGWGRTVDFPFVGFQSMLIDHVLLKRGKKRPFVVSAHYAGPSGPHAAITARDLRRNMLAEFSGEVDSVDPQDPGRAFSTKMAGLPARGWEWTFDGERAEARVITCGPLNYGMVLWGTPEECEAGFARFRLTDR